MRRTILVLGLLLGLVGTGCGGSSGTTTSAAAATDGPPAASAPTGAVVKITAPTSDQALPAGDLKVTVDFTGPKLVAVESAQRLEDYHLNFMLDEAPTQFIGKRVAIPMGNPKIIQATAGEVTFKALAAGKHSVAVILAGNNRVATNPAIWDTVSFVVR